MEDFISRRSGKTIQLKAKAFDELQKLIKKGLLIDLPCKVGDIVYIIIYSKLKIFEYKIKEIHICWNDTYFLLTSLNEDSPNCYRKLLTNLSMINENWYLDKAKAEKELKELNNET